GRGGGRRDRVPALPRARPAGPAGREESAQGRPFGKCDMVAESATAEPHVEKLLVAGLRGFCAGVVRAIDIVEKAIEGCDGPVYVRRVIIHNRFVVDELRQKGARFVEEVDEAPDGSWLVFSAHGVSPEVRQRARERGLKTIDATCPLVTKVH